MAQSNPEIVRLLRPFGRRLRLADVLRWAARTVWLPALGFALVQGAGRLFPIPNWMWWSLVPFALWFVALLVMIVRPQSTRRIAQRSDVQLDLRERLSTALELSSNPDAGPLDDVQHNDALSAARAANPRQIRLAPPRRDRPWWALAATLLLLGGLSAALPNPQRARLAEQAALEADLEKIAERVDLTRETIAKDQTLSPEERAELERQLAELSKDLRENTSSREDALARISRTEQNLQKRLDSRAGTRRASLEELAQALQNQRGEQAAQRQNPEQAAAELEKTADNVGQMSAEQREQLAQALEQQANRAAASDPALAQNLRDAASALRQGDTAQAESALRQASQQAAQSAQELRDQQGTEQALGSLQESRDQAAQAGQPGEQGQGQPGQGQPGQGQPGQGQPGQGQPGQGQPGQGQPGQGQPGQGQPGQGQPGQGQGANGGGGSNSPNLGQGNSNGSGNVDSGRDDRSFPGTGNDKGLVYQPWQAGDPNNPSNIQGQPGQGGQAPSMPGNTTGPGIANGSQVPYSQANPAYRDSAGRAVDSGYISPQMKDIIRSYFNELEK